MAARIEIAVNRTSDEYGGTLVSTSIGLISFPVDDPTKVNAPNPLDYQTLLTLKAFCDSEIAKAQEYASAIGVAPVTSKRG